MSFLERLKNKPSHVKGQYAFFIAFGLTGIIALVWSFSLPARFANMDTHLQGSESGEDGVFGEMIEEVESQLGNVIESNTPSNLETLENESTTNNEEYISMPMEEEKAPSESQPTEEQVTTTKPAEEPKSPDPKGPSNVIFDNSSTTVP